MTHDFENMLHLFGANATGNTVHIDEQLNIEQIRKYSLEQGIWPMVYPELAKLADVSKYQLECFSMITKGIAQKEYTLGVIRKLEEEGIKCCLLKGATISHLYADPECRISGDTDILIDPKDEKHLVRLLKVMGYDVEPRGRTDHHLQAYHKRGGLLEAHVMLYSHPTTKILFNGLKMYNEPWTKLEIDGYKYNVLGLNDGLMYLTAHYIKHLVNSGGGVRQMMDLLLYIEKYKDSLDLNAYDELLKNLKYDKLIDTVKTIGAKYFGFNYEIKNEGLAERILTDTEMGGIFGFSTNTRKNFYANYCKKRASMSKCGFKLFMMSKDDRGLAGRVFPSKNILVNVMGYKYAKHTILMPIAWLNRLFDAVFKRRKASASAPISKEFSERMKLMQDLEMVE